MKKITGVILIVLLMQACSPTKKAQTSLRLIYDSSVAMAHMGMAVYDVAGKKMLYNYQGDKYFTPASNIKLLTTYAAMKYLGDSLEGIRYNISNTGSILFEGTGDPTLLHSDFSYQPVFNFLKKQRQISYRPPVVPITPLGKGWSWDDYQDEYMPERSDMPVYGNCAKFFIQQDSIAVVPNVFFNGHLAKANSILKTGDDRHFTITRPFEENTFHTVSTGKNGNVFYRQYVPFKTVLKSGIPITTQLLADTLHTLVGISVPFDTRSKLPQVIYSQPVDSVLKMMLRRSDNFFAEQLLLMAGNARLQYMREADIIDTIIKNDFKNFPQPPVWVDGSGLSRYNLFTPNGFVSLLLQMKAEFGMPRLQTVLATGGSGTLSSYYKQLAGKIFAKTGTLSNNVALSGFLYTKKNKLLAFSILVNNHTGSATSVRRAVEKFLLQLYEGM